MIEAEDVPVLTMSYLGRKSTKFYREHELKEQRHLWDGVTPKYDFGCKRVLMSEHYYAAMARSNVRLHSSHIEKIVERTIYTKDGSKEEVDVSSSTSSFSLLYFLCPLNH